MNKDKIRPIYSELQGYLSQAPKLEENTSEDSNLWNALNSSIEELNKITTNDYSKFKIVPTHSAGGEGWLPSVFMDISTYRSKLAGLISRLHGEYFYDEVAPFSGTPSSVFSFSQSQNQTQQQTVQVTLYQMYERIDEALKDENTSLEERSFLDKLKAQLPFITGVLQIMELIIKLAKENSIGLQRLQELLFR